MFYYWRWRSHRRDMFVLLELDLRLAPLSGGIISKESEWISFCECRRPDGLENRLASISNSSRRRCLLGPDTRHNLSGPVLGKFQIIRHGGGCASDETEWALLSMFRRDIMLELLGLEYRLASISSVGVSVSNESEGIPFRR